MSGVTGAKTKAKKPKPKSSTVAKREAKRRRGYEFSLTPIPELPDLLTMLVFGASGAGKTHLAGTLDDIPELHPVLYLHREGGVRTIRHVEHFEVEEVTSTAVVEAVRLALREDPNRWGVVVMDSLSGLYDLLLEELVRKGCLERPSHDKLVPELRDYLKAKIIMSRYARVLTKLPCHFIATCLEHTTRDELSGMIRTLPALAGKLEHELGKYFDIVGYLSVQVGEGEDERERVLMLEGTRRIQAKNRFHALGTSRTNPTFPELMEAIFGKLPRKTPRKHHLGERGYHLAPLPGTTLREGGDSSG